MPFSYILIPLFTVSTPSSANAPDTIFSFDTMDVETKLNEFIPNIATPSSTDAPSTWWYVDYVITHIPDPVIFRSYEHPIFKRMYRGYLTYREDGFSPGTYRVYEGLLYRDDLPYPGLARIQEQ